MLSVRCVFSKRFAKMQVQSLGCPDDGLLGRIYSLIVLCGEFILTSLPG